MNRKIAPLLRRPLGVLLPLLLGLTAHSAFAADDWAPTATRAFVPTLLRAPASPGSSTARLQASLRSASSHAARLAGDDTRNIDVVVSLKPRDEAGLDQWLAQRLDQHPLPALSRDELIRRHAPSQAQVDAVVAHLRAAGFSRIQVAPNRLLIEARGPVGAVENAFHTGLNHFQYQGRDVITNTEDAEVPQALAGTVQAVLGLQTAVQAHTLYHIVKPAGNGSARPDASGSTFSHQLTDFPVIYHADGLPKGSDTTVAIITAYDLSDTLANLRHFAADHQLTVPPTQVVKTSTGNYASNDDATGEWSLDSQAIVAVSGGVKTLQFFNAPDLSDAALLKAYNAAVNDGSAKAVNVSLGLDEAVTHADGSQASEDAIFKLAAAQGQTFSISSGDEGVYEAEGGYIRAITDPASYTVSDPATSPWALAIGGTEVATSGNTGYVGEVTWNEGLDWFGRLWSTGGGISKYEAAPAWQTRYLGSRLTTGQRVLPDFSFDASGTSGAQVYVDGGYINVGGTSLAAPIFAGLWARLQTANRNNLGFAATELYPLASANPTVLHDVVSGNNGYNGYGYQAGPGWDYPTGWGSFDTAGIQSLLQQAAR